MNETNVLKKLKQCFSKIIPKTDIRTNISPFGIGLIFSYLGDTNLWKPQESKKSNTTRYKSYFGKGLPEKD